MSTNLKESHYKGSKGIILETTDGKPINTVSEKNMYNKLSDVGFVLYRGFDVNINTFSEFVKNGSSRVTIDPMREFFGDSVQKVDAGSDAIGMHVEHGNNPFQPDICWFFCEVAANQGSQTTICDGYKVWDNMPAQLKEKFLNKKIKYCRYIEGDKWKTLVKNLNPEINSIADVTLDDFKSLIDNAGFHVELRENDTIYYEYTTCAVHRDGKTQNLSFSNSILGPSYNYQAPKIVFEDDEEISNDTLSLLEKLFEDATTDIDWVSGDVVVLDNIHIMHGRRAIQDKNRTLFNAMSFR